MRPRLATTAAVGLLAGLVACGGSRPLELPAQPPTVPPELLHTLQSPVSTIPAPGGEATPAPGGATPAPGGEATPAPDGAATPPLPTEQPTPVPTEQTDGAEPGPAAVEEPSP